MMGSGHSHAEKEGWVVHSECIECERYTELSKYLEKLEDDKANKTKRRISQNLHWSVTHVAQLTQTARVWQWYDANQHNFRLFQQMTQEVCVCKNQITEDILAKEEYFKSERIGIEPGSPKSSTACELVAKLRSGILCGTTSFHLTTCPPAQDRTGDARDSHCYPNLCLPQLLPLHSYLQLKNLLVCPFFLLGFVHVPIWMASPFQPLAICLVLEDAAIDT